MNTKSKAALIAGVAILLIVVTLTVVFLEAFASPPTGGSTRVACLGDSITQITGYPDDLQMLLGNGSVVGNYGSTGSSVNMNAELPYYYETAFRMAKRSSPSTVVIMLGTNDAHDYLHQYIGSFVGDYETIIHSLQKLNSNPKIFLVLPPPVFDNTLGIDGTFYSQEVIPRIRQVATETGLTLIDVYDTMLAYPQDLSDGVHPNAAGAQVIAQIVCDAIKS